jgi:hypothetical protein
MHFSQRYIPQPKSLYESQAVSNFYGTEMEIWAGFGPVGITGKKFWVDFEQLLRVVLSCFHGQKKLENFLKNVVASALKSCIK